jgi:lactate dehydrogenase-like 2-hydroxyacid dehydrogenase
MRPFSLRDPVHNRVRFTESLLSRIRHVKLISQTGPWLSHIDLGAAKRLGISVARCPDDGDEVVKTSTVEQTCNLIPALTRDTELNQKFRDQHAGVAVSPMLLTTSEIGVPGAAHCTCIEIKLSIKISLACDFFRGGRRLTPYGKSQ